MREKHTAKEREREREREERNNQHATLQTWAPMHNGLAMLAIDHRRRRRRRERERRNTHTNNNNNNNNNKKVSAHHDHTPLLFGLEVSDSSSFSMANSKCLWAISFRCSATREEKKREYTSA
jgi:hypothetical protein